MPTLQGNAVKSYAMGWFATRAGGDGVSEGCAPSAARHLVLVPLLALLLRLLPMQRISNSLDCS